MAHSLSAKKRVRQNAKTRLLNRARRSAIKTELRDTLGVLHGSDAKAAATKVGEAIVLLDRESSKGLIHKNAAARQKSRLMRKLNKLSGKTK